MPDPYANGAEDYADSLMQTVDDDKAEVTWMALAKARTRLAIAKTRIDRAQAELSSAENEWRDAYKVLNRLEDESFITQQNTMGGK